MATINLGRIKPVFKGAYASGTAYVVDDIVVYSDESYICIQAGTGQTPSSATAYWTKMAAKGTNGTNGTDVGTVLTTQGDILYRDGSGLQRLPKGTAGQVLKMNSSANAPEYGNLSSDFVKIQSTTVSSNVSSVTLTGFDDSIYASYLVRINNAITELTGTQRGRIMMRVNTSGGVQTSNYIYTLWYKYRRWDDNSTPDGSTLSEGDDKIKLHDWNLSANDAQNTDITFANPQSTSHAKIFNCSTTSWKHLSTGSDGPYTFTPIDINGVYQATTALTGITFLPTASSATAIAGGNFSLYGLKK